MTIGFFMHSLSLSLSPTVHIRWFPAHCNHLSLKKKTRAGHNRMFGLSVLPLSPAPQLSLHLFAVAKCFYEFVSWLTSTLLIESNAKGKRENGKTKPTYCHNGRLMVIPGLVAISWSWWQSEASLLFAKTSCCSGCLSFSTSLFFFTFFLTTLNLPRFI